MTFVPKKLASDIASKQLKENLPHLPESLLKKEWEARESLARSLAHQTTLETCLHMDIENSMYAVLAKQHMWSFLRDVDVFIKARKACRVHVLANARVRHEANQLIHSSPWGTDLFPAAVVKSVLDKAANENRSLLDRWDARPKFGGKKRSMNFQQGKQKKSRPYKPQYRVSEPAPNSSVSPATNPRFEQNLNTFRPVTPQQPSFRARGRGRYPRSARGGSSRGGSK